MNNDYDVNRLNGITESLIFDRTQADVDYALMLERESVHIDIDLKGAYNSSDKNRVGGAVNYIAALMQVFDVKSRADWTAGDIVKSPDNANIIRCLHRLARFLPCQTIEIPDDLDRLSYQKANAVERVLFDMYGIYSRICGAVVFCGDGYPADSQHEFDAPNTQMFDDAWIFTLQS